jgi:hypothetical protein
MLHIAAFVEVPFGFDNASLYMDKIREGQSSTKTTYIVVKDPQTTRVKELKSSSEYIVARVLDEPKVSMEGKIPVEITVKPGFPMGRFSGTITAISTVDSLPTALLRVSGSVIGEVEVSPDAVRFVIMKNSDNSVVPTFQKISVVNHSEGRPLAITKAVDPTGMMSIEERTVKEGEEYTLIITPKNPSVLTANQTGTIDITTDNPNQKELQVHYSVIQQ